MLSGAEAINLNVSVRNLTLVGGELDGVYKCRETLTLKLTFRVREVQQEVFWSIEFSNFARP